jgi:hypothetical protein
MALPRCGKSFNGATSLTDAHDIIQWHGCNATFVNEYQPNERCNWKMFAEVLLWLMYSFDLCCAIAGDTALYKAGMLGETHEFLTIYIAYHEETLSTLARMFLVSVYRSLFHRVCWLWLYLLSTTWKLSLLYCEMCWPDPEAETKLR